MSGHLQFPPNPRRPEQVGTGHRKPLPTPGLANHNAEQKKNKEKGRRAKLTRDRNAAAAKIEAARAAMAVTPSSAVEGAPGLRTQQPPQQPPQTPSSAPASRSRAPQTEQRPPYTPRLLSAPSSAPSAARPHTQETQRSLMHQLTTPSIPRPPLVPMAHQTSSPYHPTSSPSPFNPVPFPSLSRVVPQNYQPTYPDYSQSASTASTPGSDRDDNARLAEMASRMSREDITLMLSYSAGTEADYSRDYNGNAGSDINYDAGTANTFGELLPSDSNDGYQSDDRDDQPSWTQDTDDPPPDEPEDSEEPQDPHANAQSSLEAGGYSGIVVMHDVDVRKKKRKRRVISRDSDSDDHTSAPSTKKKRKKRANRRQKSRSIREVDEERQRIIRAAYPFIQEAVAISKPWPAASPTGDPGAGDDELEDLLDDAWDKALEFLNLDESDDDLDPRTTQESNLIQARIPQLRGAIMTIADALVVIHYKFTDPHAMEDPSPETLAATKDCNRQLVQDLQGTYMYRDYRNISDIADICRHPIFQQLLNKAFFAKTGINRRAHYFKGLHALPKETLGLMMDSIMCGIDRWNTGEHNPRSAPFDAKTYAPIHAESIRFLDAWMGEYQCEENGHPVDLSATCLREMLSKARAAAGTPVEQPAKPSRFPMHVFSKAAAAAARPTNV